MSLVLLILTIYRFNGAYCTEWEKDSCEDLFDKMDVVAGTLPDLAVQIIGAG